MRSVPVPPGKSTSSPQGTSPIVLRHGSSQQWVQFDMTLARDGSVDPTDKALYAALASFIDPTTGRSSSGVAASALGNYVPSKNVPTRKRLAECIGKTIYTVDRSLKRLEALGLVRIHRMTHPDNPKMNVPSEYELLPYQPQPAPVPKVPAPRPRNRLPISAAKRARIMARDNHQCLKCGTSEDLTVDHVQHWSRGGTNADDNLRVLCRSCNSRRNDGVLEGLDS